MKKRFFSKAAVAVFILMVSAVSISMEAVDGYRIKVKGTDGNTPLGIFDTSKVSYIEVVEYDGYPDAEVDVNGNILIKLTPEINFRMIKVEGGEDYKLIGATWTGSTKKIETFYLGQFEVTQGLWKNIKGTLPSGQSNIADNCPVANVTWNNIAGSANNTFLKLINAKLTELKLTNPTIATLLGNREFRLPSEWEWEYAAAGGKDYATLKYYFSGTQGQTAEDLQTVAVNSVEPNKATSVATVGSKLPNALGLYDMSGNVWEWCSGLGYPEYETTEGYYGTSWNSNSRPYRGGGWVNSPAPNFRVADRYGVSASYTNDDMGFRLAL